jgi:signal transduction histidine kinase/ActR/RegA family two-component response regulator
VQPDGKIRWLHSRDVPFKRSADGSVIQVLGIASDITEQVEYEKNQKFLESQLQHAQKMEAIGTLAGGISHDFNNILQAIQGYAQLLLMDTPPSGAERENLEAITNSVDKAAGLVQQLLLFSRKAASNRRVLDLNQEIESAHRILGRTIPKMIDIKLHLGGRLWSVHADPVQIEQILLNLGSNAADAMPQGGAIHIETQNTFFDEEVLLADSSIQPGRYVLLMFSDTGVGIEEPVLRKVFEPFFTTKPIGQGTGLGLASVYGIVKSHYGYITCNSVTGHGTTFNIYLPALEENTHHADPVPEKGQVVGGTEAILLVDDEDQIRDFASQSLKRQGYHVFTAKNGEEALEVYAQNIDRIDLVVLDIGMPGMGGHKCLEELYKMDPSVLILIATGYPASGKVKDCLASGAIDLLEKPYPLHDLLHKIRRILDDNRPPPKSI